jgi:hypothetical protein
MKAQYFVPSTVVMEMHMQTSILVSVSGLDLNDKGTDDGSHPAHSRHRVF